MRAAVESARADAKRRTDELIARLRGGPHGSIDAMLARWPDLVDLGKRILAAMIAVHQEMACELSFGRGWHYWLAQQCQPSKQGDEAGRDGAESSGWQFDNVAVVTFNYDLLLEYHLDTLVANWSSDESRQPSLPSILHVYGQLDRDAIWDANEMRMMANRTPEVARASVDALRIAGGRDSDDDIDNRIRATIERAEQLVFLGFAFDPINFAKLGFHPEKKTPLRDRLYDNQCEVFTTAFGLPKRTKDMVSRAMRDLEPTFGEPTEGCAECLREWNLK